MKIHGKEYIEVKDRILEFRNNEKYKGWALRSDITHMDGDTVVVKAFILDENERLIATGIASEVKGSSHINSTSHIENCETSAWGRALANIGIGIVESVASADEVYNAVKQQETGKPTKSTKSVMATERQVLLLKSKGKYVEGMTKDEASEAIRKIM